MEVVRTAKPASLNSQALTRELSAASFAVLQLTEVTPTELEIEFLGTLTPERIAQVHTIVATHTGAKSPEQSAEEAAAEKERLKEVLLDNLVAPPAAGKTWSADPGDPALGRWIDPPSSFVVPLLVNPTAALTNAPAGGTEPPGGQCRVWVDLRGTAICRVQALFSVIPAATGTLIVEYSLDDGVNWALLANSGFPHVANVPKAGTPTPIPPAARVTGALLRGLVTGNGIADPVLQRAAITVSG